MADDLKYGYKGAEPTQSFGNNTGVFDPNDINNLIADNKWTQFGQLELIETQTASETYYDFTNLGNYNVHFLTFNNAGGSTQAYFNIRLSNDNGSNFIASGYQYAAQYGQANGTFGPLQSTSTTSFLGLTGYTLASETGSSAVGYVYLYNLLDSSKYSFCTYQTMTKINSAQGNQPQFRFGSAVLPTAETHNAIRFFNNATTSNDIDSISLYGIRYS